MRVLPAMAFAAVMVYSLSGYIGRWFSPNVTSVIDLFLFVIVFVAMNAFLKNLRGD